jgi:AcrR family transcriptional regulator
MEKAGKDDRSAPKAAPRNDPREKIVDALMGLAAERPWDEISLADVADRAGVTLAQFRDFYPSKGAVLGGFSRRIDRQVLEGGASAGESAKDRLFDVLMRRFDAMAPYKEALKNIDDWAMRDPFALPSLNQMALNSLRFMLEAAGLSSEQPLGALKLQCLALAWARVFHVWLSDDSADNSQTMAALDRELARGEILVERADEARRRLEPLAKPWIKLAERVLGAAARR